MKKVFVAYGDEKVLIHSDVLLSRQKKLEFLMR